MKRNSSKPKRRYGDAGFTLVELVVVIAVLAILAGVGAVAYNGYIEYANKGVDRQTVGEIMHAIELADYSDPTLFGVNPSGVVYLTPNGAIGNNSATQKAIEDAGLNSSTLAYGGWDGAIPLSDAKSRLISALDELSFLGQDASNGGLVELIYADTAGESWDAVKKAAAFAAGRNNGVVTDEGMIAVVLYAAQQAGIEGAQWSWKDFTTWNDGAKGLSVVLPSLVARNYSFAAYLEKNGNYDGIEDDIEYLQNFAQVEADNGLVDYLSATNWSKNPTEVSRLASEYLTSEVYNGKSQAEIDSEGYYLFMSNLFDKYGDDTETNELGYPIYHGDADFWEEAGSYIETAGQLAQMSVAERTAFLNALPEDGKAVQVIVRGRNADGTLSIAVIPSSAKPTTTDAINKDNEDVEPGTAPTEPTTSVALNFINQTAEFSTSSGGDIVLKKGTNISINVANVALPTDDTIKITSVEINNTTINRSNTTSVSLSNGTAAPNGWPGRGVKIKLTAGNEVGQSTVTIKYNFENMDSQTITFTFWVIE